MSEVQGDGAPLLEHVKALAAAGDEEEIERLQRVAYPPDGAGEVWSIFGDLSLGRGSTGMGPAALGYRDIEAWQNVTGDRLEAWERRAVLAVDKAFLSSLAQRSAGKA